MSARAPDGSESGLSGNTKGFILPRKGEVTGSPLTEKKGRATQMIRFELSGFGEPMYEVFPSKHKTPILLFQKRLQLLVDKMHV